MKIAKGTVERIESKDVYVRTQSNDLVRTVVPGKIKNKYHLKKNKQNLLDIVTIGDFVTIELDESNFGKINEIYERKNYIARKAPRIKGRGLRGERLEQIMAANVDYLMIVSSIDEPRFNNKFIDRMIVIAESSHVEPIIIINKIDLDNKLFKYWEDVYKKIGYKVIGTSTLKKINIGKVKKIINGKRSIFWGQSGVGKSSLLNSLFPDLKLKVGEVSAFSNKGMHTTVTSAFFSFDTTEVIDTPGVREIEPFGIKKEDLSHYFIDFSDFENKCKFYSCTHFHEPGCAVRKAVEKNEIHEARYQSYLNLLENVEEDIIF